MSVMVRALHSLTALQVREIVSTFEACGSMWTVDQHADYNGYMLAMVTHEPTGATFTISGRADQIEIDELRADMLHQLGRFNRIEEAIAYVMGCSPL